MSGLHLKKIAGPIFSVGIIVVITLFLTEILLQIVRLKKDAIGRTFLGRLSESVEPPFSWERYFLSNHASGREGVIPNVAQDGLHQPHPTRGWGLKPNNKVQRRGKTYTTNGQGYRSLHEYGYDSREYGVMVVGDSFTFGDGIDDADAWPYLLQQMDKRLNVFNMAGSGYGVDQMYITLMEEASIYRPKLIIAAFIDDNLRRSMLYFRDYKKPRFEIKGDRLILTNTPVGSVEEVISEISQSDDNADSTVVLINILNKIRWKLDDTDYVRQPVRSDLENGCRDDCRTLNDRLFENMAAIAKKNSADFLMIYLPYGQEIFDREYFGYGEEYFNNYKNKPGHDNFFLTPRKELLGANFPKSEGHYRRDENKLLAMLVFRTIRGLPSWKDNFEKGIVKVGARNSN